MVYWPDVGVAAAGSGMVSEIINIVESTGSLVESIVSHRYTAEPSCSDDSSENSGFCLYTKAFVESLWLRTLVSKIKAPRFSDDPRILR